MINNIYEFLLIAKQRSKDFELLVRGLRMVQMGPHDSNYLSSNSAVWP